MESFRKLRGQSSIAIENTSLGIIWSEDENKMPLNRLWRQSKPSEVHSYNEFINMFICIIPFALF